MNKLGCMADLWLFDQLTPTERSEVQNLTRKQFFERDELLFVEGAPAESVFLVTEGRIKLTRVSEEGKEIILGFLTPHALFGENTLFANSVQPMTATAVEATRICACSRRDFENLVRKNSSIAMKVIQTLGEKLNQAMEQVADFALYDVRERVAHTLKRLATEYGEPTPQGLRLNFRLTHEDIATLVGASRVMVTNVLQGLRSDGQISMDAKQRYVVNLNSQYRIGVAKDMEPEKGSPPAPCPCFRGEKSA